MQKGQTASISREEVMERIAALVADLQFKLDDKASLQQLKTAMKGTDTKL